MTRLAPAPAWLLAWCLLHLLVLGLWAEREPRLGVDPAFRQVRLALADGKQGEDSWKPMIPAYSHAATGGGATLYTDVFFDRQIKFQYPPTALLVFPALEAAGVGPADQRPALLGLSIAMFGALVVALAALAQAAFGGWGGLGLRGRPADRWAIGAAAAIAAATYYPVAKALGNGQIQLWISAGVALALLAWLHGRRGAAGALLALAAALKPHFGLVLVWGLLRGERRFALAFVATAAAALAASAACFGWAAHVAYLDALRFMARHAELHWHNQSFAGLLLRLYDDLAPIRTPGTVFPPYVPAVHLASAAFGAALVGAALVLAPRAGRAGGAIDLGIMLASLTLAAPIAWIYHYGTFLPLFVLVAALLTGPAGQAARHRGVALGLAAAAYLATGTQWQATLALAGTAWSPLISVGFFGGLALLGLLYATARLEPAAPEAP